MLVGHCPAYGDGVTYWPLREMVLQALRGRALTSVLAPTEDGRGAAATIAATLGLGGQASADAAPWAFRMLFTTLARRGALVLAFEDAHWASRRCSTSSSSWPAGRWRRPSCCCASGVPSC